MTRRLGTPTNDDRPPGGRLVHNELSADTPIAEAEFALVENCFAEIIDRLLASLANGEKGPADREAEP
ncbi:MAG: hypothetical protein ACOZAA_06450 [Pseudomonadota bacterium]